jgi:hypothetical protein
MLKTFSAAVFLVPAFFLGLAAPPWQAMKFLARRDDGPQTQRDFNVPGLGPIR